MKVNHYEHVPQQPVEMEGSHGCQVRWLLGERDGTPNFAMRQFEVAPGGYTPRHSHPYEHEVFVLEGEGSRLRRRGDQPHPLKAGDVVLRHAGRSPPVPQHGPARRSSSCAWCRIPRRARR